MLEIALSFAAAASLAAQDISQLQAVSPQVQLDPNAAITTTPRARIIGEEALVGRVWITPVLFQTAGEAERAAQAGVRGGTVVVRARKPGDASGKRPGEVQRLDEGKDADPAEEAARAQIAEILRQQQAQQSTARKDGSDEVGSSSSALTSAQITTLQMQQMAAQKEAEANAIRRATDVEKLKMRDEERN